jgi:hypothetical protein
MATIVENIESKKRFVLIGSSFSYFKEVSEHRFLKFLRNTEEGEFEVITISDENGEILFRNADEFKVVEIDGKTISEVLRWQ